MELLYLGDFKMNNHYYTQNPDVVHDRKTWAFNLLGHELHFITDNGVFSKTTVDYGSRTLLEAATLTDAPAGKFLDLGCGYGPIGLALAKQFSEREIDMVDVNELALSLAAENAQQNQIDNVNIFSSDGYENIQAKYAAILTNPPVRAGKKVVDHFISQAKQHLVENGSLWVVLQKKQGAPSAKNLMTDTFGNCEIVKRNKGYYILKSILTGEN